MPAQPNHRKENDAMKAECRLPHACLYREYSLALLGDGHSATVNGVENKDIIMVRVVSARV